MNQSWDIRLEATNTTKRASFFRTFYDANQKEKYILDLREAENALRFIFRNKYDVNNLVVQTGENDSLSIRFILSCDEDETAVKEYLSVTRAKFVDVQPLKNPIGSLPSSSFDPAQLLAALSRNAVTRVTFDGETQLRPLKHETDDCTCTLFPYITKENMLVIFVFVRLIYLKGKHQKFTYGCATTPEPAGQTFVYGLNFDPSMHPFEHTTDKAIGVSGSGGMTGLVPSVSLSPSASYGTHKTETRTDFEATQESGGRATGKPTKGLFVHYDLKKDLDYEQVVNQVHAFLFPIANLSKLELKNVRIDSHFLIEYPRELGRLKKLEVNSVCSFGLEQNLDAREDIIIGAIVGEPRSGKTSFINAFSKLQGKFQQVGETPYLKRHLFLNVAVTAQLIRSFVMLDTRGFFFDVNNTTDVEILEKFLNGLPEKTVFSRNPEIVDYSTVPLDTRNRPTHVILVFNAWTFSKPAISWWSWFFGQSNNLQPNNLQHFVSLWKRVVQILSRIHSIDEYEAKEKTFILVTHMDMIPPNERVKIKNQIREDLVRVGVASNAIFFGAKECEWNQTTLLEYQQKISRVLEQVGQDEDAQDVAETMNQPLHIPENKCVRANCQHLFTDDALKNFGELLTAILQSDS